VFLDCHRCISFFGLSSVSKWRLTMCDTSLSCLSSTMVEGTLSALRRARGKLLTHEHRTLRLGPNANIDAAQFCFTTRKICTITKDFVRRRQLPLRSTRKRPLSPHEKYTSRERKGRPLPNTNIVCGWVQEVDGWIDEKNFGISRPISHPCTHHHHRPLNHQHSSGWSG
jgi:hypothetical protein